MFKKLLIGAQMLLFILTCQIGFSQLAGSTFTNPAIVGSLPYVNSGDSTCGYGDNYSTTNIACTGSYLNGDEKIYSFTPSSAISNFNVELTNIATTWSGMFITDDSTTSGNCLGNVQSSGTADRGIYNLSLSAGTTYYIIVSTYATPQCITSFDINMYSISCPAPSAISDSTISSTTAIINWTETGSATQWQVQYDTSGFSLGSGTVDTNTMGYYPLSSLTVSTAYDFYVRSVCGAADTSNWTGPFTFSTACNTISTFPFTETFESSSLSLSCWSNSYEVGSSDWTFSSGAGSGSITSANSGSSNARFVSQSGTNSPVTKLVSPIFDLSGVSNPRVVFHYGQEEWFGDQNYTRLLYRTSSTSSWVEIWSDSTSKAVWTSATISLPNASATYQIAFEGINNYGYANVIDDVIIEQTPACLAVDSLLASNFSPNSAQLSWVELGTGAQWMVQYDTTGFTLGNGTDSLSTSTSMTLNGLNASTTYDFYVRSICGVGDTSTWTGPVSFSTLCNSDLAPYTESFDVAISSCWSQTAVTGGPWTIQGTPGYGASNASDHTGNGGEFIWMDFSSTDEAVSLEMNNVDVSALTVPGLAFYFYTNNVNDNSINDLIVEAFDGSSWVEIDSIHQNLGGWTKFEYDLTGFTYAGNLVKIRFRAESGGASNDYYQDFLLDDISINEAPSCFNLTDLQVNNISIDSALVSWNQPGVNDSIWVIEFDTSGFSLGQGTSDTAISELYQMTGLNSNTSYDVYVRSICAAGDTSAWIGPITFSTNCGIFNVPFNEGFNSNSGTINCWTVINGNADADTWSINSSSIYVQEGDQSMQINTDFNGGNNLDVLASPGIVLAGNEQLRYWYRARSSNEPNDYKVLISDDLDSPTFVDTLLLDTANSQTYQERILDLSLYSGTHYIGFLIDSNGLDGWQLFIDNFTVEPIPVPLSISSTITDATCDYDTDGSISVVAANGSGAPYTYNWSNGDTTSTISNLFGGVYYVTVYDAAMDSISDTLTVQSFAAVNVNLGNDTAICDGQTFTLDAGNFVSYSWDASQTTQTRIVSGISGQVALWVEVIDTNSCLGSDTILVTGLAPVVVNLGADTTLCDGDSLILNAGTFSTYIWNDGSTNASLIVANNPGINQYSVDVTDVNGCSGTDSIEVTTFNAVVVDLGNDTAICDGASITLNAGMFDTYLWDDASNTQSRLVNSTLGINTYWLAVTDANGCNGSDTIEVEGLAPLSVTLGQDTTICFADNLTLDAGAFDQYVWSDASTAQTLVVGGNVGASIYAVTVTDLAGCSANASVEITVLPQVVVDLGSDTLITDTTANVILDAGAQFSSYLWSDGSNQQLLVVTKANSGQIFVEVTNDIGCAGSDTVNVDFATSVNSVAIGTVKLYPNPVATSLVIELGNLTGQGDVSVKLMNVNGQVFVQKQISAASGRAKQTIDVSNLASGSYFVELMYSGQREVRTIIVE